MVLVRKKVTFQTRELVWIVNLKMFSRTITFSLQEKTLLPCEPQHFQKI